jgi:uncharacterized protein YdbL (DUF1318 family)
MRKSDMATTGKKTNVWVCVAAVLVAWFGLTATASAITLDDARSQGFVGERADGLIGAVSGNPSTEVSTLVSQVNAARMNSYRQVADKDGAPVQAVQAIAGEKLLQMARQNGWYFMDTAGSWRR